MIKTSESTKALIPALFAAQKQFTSVTKSASNPFFKSKYADLNSILDVIKEPLETNNLMLLQPNVTDGINNYVTSRIVHAVSGEWIESTMKLEVSKPGMQDLGSATSYARRYSIQSLLSLQASDDDGEAAMDRKSKKLEAAPKNDWKTEADTKPKVKPIESDDKW